MVLLVHTDVAMKPLDSGVDAKRIADVIKSTSNAKEQPEAVESIDVTPPDADKKLDRPDHIILGED
ncbi:hypothetical protein BH11MYX2_BH11MYX2_37780 [soil metagenome]